MKSRRFILLFLLLLGWLWLFRLPVSAQSAGPVYIVQPGDTLSLIALRFGTTVDALVAANNIIDPGLIIPGKELLIPGFEGISGVLQFRQIELGETLASMGLFHGIARETLVQLNRVVNPNRLYVGQSFVYIQSEEQQPFSNARIQIPQGDETQLEFAARNLINPWALADLQGYLSRLWILPRENLVVQGGNLDLNCLPEPFQSVSIKPIGVTQGRTLVVEAQLFSPAVLNGRIGDRQLHFHQNSDLEYIALQGIHALTEPGMYDLEIVLQNETDDAPAFTFTQPIRVISGGYGYDPVLYVPPETVDPDNMGPEDDLIASVVDQDTEEKYWQGAFQFPSSYTESFPSVFGSRRNYNGVGYLWYHTGLDFYGGSGTPILAPAKGKVVYTGLLEVRGNVTFIDHGWGVYTGYLHQSQIFVSAGDLVEVGQEIGLVGRTGRATGPHLHWEIWVGGVPVDPIEWVSETFSY